MQVSSSARLDFHLASGKSNFRHHSPYVANDVKHKGFSVARWFKYLNIYMKEITKQEFFCQSKVKIVPNTKLTKKRCQSVEILRNLVKLKGVELGLCPV